MLRRSAPPTPPLSSSSRPCSAPSGCCLDVKRSQQSRPLLSASSFTTRLRGWRRKRIQRKCLYLHKCGGCLLGLCVWLSKCKRDSPALHAAQKRQQPMGGGGEAENLQQLDFSTCGPNARADALFVFKQSNFSFMITLHHPRLQLHLSALRTSAVCADFL